MAHTHTYRLGVDVGGTFTDLVLLDEVTGGISLAKVPSTPHNQAVGVETGVRQLLAAQGATADAVALFIHGTTVATNALLERKGAACALLVTEGFRDILQIGRQDRPKLYDWFARRPAPLVPRHLRLEIRERVTHTGEILQPLDEAHAIGLIQQVAADGIPAIAVCLLHAYANPSHEQRLGELIAQYYPQAIVSLSSDVLPEFKEYERMSTTVVNAYVRPTMQRYLSHLETRLKDIGIRSNLHIMQSNGGIMSAQAAGEMPVHTILSGPAGGALGGVAIARQAGFENAITVDMGGTSFDICLAYQGTIRRSQENEVGSVPIKVPMLDIHTLGAGGGSIAWIDGGGALRVGPHSAGAAPGPACYGRGGTEPTVTDANLVLGRIPDTLGSGVALDHDAARQVIYDRLARPLGMRLEQAAEGIITVVNANMARGIRVVSVAKGYDPREFALVAFGGGGALHGAELASDLAIPTVLVPPAPGVTSALGLLMADFRHDYSVTHLRLLKHVTPAELRQHFQTLEDHALAQMEREGIPPSRVMLTRTVGLRYRGQGYELEAPLSAGQIDDGIHTVLAEGLHLAHQRSYGYAMREQDIELVTLKLAAVGGTRLDTPLYAGQPQPTTDRPTFDPQSAPVTATRPVYLRGQWLPAAIYQRPDLAPGLVLAGPAVVEHYDATTLVLPGQQARVDIYGNMIIQAIRHVGRNPSS